MPLNTVKVLFAEPRYNYSTDVSADTTEASARQYFVGQRFNMGGMSYDWDKDEEFEVDDMQQCIGIEFTDNNK